MKKRCVICLTQRIGTVVRIQVQPEELVKEKKAELGIGDMMSMVVNKDKLQKEMMRDAALMQAPDMITIPYDEWKKRGYKLDDIVEVSMTPGE